MADMPLFTKLAPTIPLIARQAKRKLAQWGTISAGKMHCYCISDFSLNGYGVLDSMLIEEFKMTIKEIPQDKTKTKIEDVIHKMQRRRIFLPHQIHLKLWFFEWFMSVAQGQRASYI
ncbi:hypothetical protein VNO77_24912 [Canavalia gladiata]|uniref:Uncharacterized protein n=1 Tax=Canavalia gladiata TaxID=3824 RepID=A0AAN9LAK9_CANGL